MLLADLALSPKLTTEAVAFMRLGEAEMIHAQFVSPLLMR
jgi:hypothetical protein